MNASLIDKWLRDPKFARELQGTEGQAALKPCFLSIEGVDRPLTEEPIPTLAANAVSGHSAIEINIMGGHLLRVVGRYDLEALARLIRGLST